RWGLGAEKEAGPVLVCWGEGGAQAPGGGEGEGEAAAAIVGVAAPQSARGLLEGQHSPRALLAGGDRGSQSRVARAHHDHVPVAHGREHTRRRARPCPTTSDNRRRSWTMPPGARAHAAGLQVELRGGHHEGDGGTRGVNRATEGDYSTRACTSRTARITWM